MLRKCSIAGSVALILSGLVTDHISAQEKGKRGGGFGFFGRPSSIVALAGIESVQSELGVSGDAKEKIAAIAEKHNNEAREQMRDAFQGFQDLSAEERQKRNDKLIEINRTLTAKYAPSVKELLKPDQYTRLQQISWQAMGGQALLDPDLEKELAINKEQKDKIAAAVQDFQKKQGELMGSFRGGGGNFQEFGTKFQELTKQRDKSVEEALTKEQQEKYAKLKGKAFDMTQLGGIGGRRGKGKQN